MQLPDLIKQRYSLRTFDPKRPVAAETISQIIEAALQAPTAHNRQAFHIYQLQGDGLAEALKAVTGSHFAAPNVLALTMDETKSWKRRDGYDNASIDVGIVGTHMILMAEYLGLGSCWVGSFDVEALAELLDLGANEFPAALFMLGYPSEQAKPGPLHDKRKSADEMVTIREF